MNARDDEGRTETGPADREPARAPQGDGRNTKSVDASHELVDAHRELARRTAELEATIRRKDEVLAMVAHDLRNPLGSVAGFGEILLRQLGDSVDPSSRRMLERISRLSDHMLALVDDLLDVTVLDSGRIYLRLDDVDVAELVAEAVEVHRHAAARKDIEIELMAHGPLVIRADEVRLLQVLDNLLTNAVKYSPNQAGATITVTCSSVDSAARLTVADEGVGIPVARQEKLFEPFASEATRGTADERSTGLGLAITRSIVEAHDGTIQVDSEPGHGSVCEVLRPLRPDD